MLYLSDKITKTTGFELWLEKNLIKTCAIVLAVISFLIILINIPYRRKKEVVPEKVTPEFNYEYPDFKKINQSDINYNKNGYTPPPPKQIDAFDQSNFNIIREEPASEVQELDNFDSPDFKEIEGPPSPPQKSPNGDELVLFNPDLNDKPKEEENKIKFFNFLIFS